MGNSGWPSDWHTLPSKSSHRTFPDTANNGHIRMQQEPFEKRAHDDDNVFPAKIASSRRRIGSGPAFLVSASHYTPRRQALSQSRTRRETNGAFVHVQERKLYGEGGRSCFWALREAHRKPIVRDLRVVVGAERAGKAFRECHRCQTSSAEASSNASSSATTTTARKQRNPRRRGGEATQQQQRRRQAVQQQRISQLSGSAFCSSSRCSFATRYGRQKTSSSPSRRAACLFRLSSGRC